MEIALGDFHDSFSPGEAICAAAQVERSRIAHPYAVVRDSVFQPRATSSIIIRVKPNAKKMVPMLECAPSLISGISSSTTT